MLPKIIHYVWVGGKPKTDLVLKCIESWKKHCPDYQIIEWNDDSLQSIDNLYVSQAYENKKWAFVSDYLRLYALYHFGGFYFDTDLELTQNIEKFRSHEFVTGFENWKGKYSPITAFMGAAKGNSIIKDLLFEYNDLQFVENGHLNLTTNTARITSYFECRFALLKPFNAAKIVDLDDGCRIYPSYYFCTPEIGKVNYAIHHFNGSWLDGYDRKDYCHIRAYRIVRFKKNFTSSSNTYPISAREKIVFSLNISSKRTFAILKVTK